MSTRTTTYFITFFVHDVHLPLRPDINMLSLFFVSGKINVCVCNVAKKELVKCLIASDIRYLCEVPIYYIQLP